MKKIITLLFCIGLFTASFSQSRDKRNNGNNAANQATQLQGNHYKNNGSSHQNYSGTPGNYRTRGNAYGHEQANRHERKRFDRYNRRSENRRWNNHEHGSRHRGHQGF
jgi:hypothetical protein